MEKLNPTLYQIEILRLLSPRYLSTIQIQEKLAERGIEKDLRTLQRDLQKLANHFAGEIDCKTDSKPYAYRWSKGAVGLNLPTLSPQQSAVLMLAEQHLKSLLPANILAEMDPFFEQARHKMKFDDNGSSAKQWLRKIAVTPTSQPLEPPALDNEIFKQISTALYENLYLEVVYQSQWKEEPSHYHIMPLALVQQGVSHYLVAQKVKNGKPVGTEFFLVLHRFISAKLLTLTFDYPSHFNLKKMIREEKRFSFGECVPIRLRFSISWEAGFHLIETPLADNQIILEKSDKHYRFQVDIIKTQMLEKWLRSFGDEIWDVEEIYLSEGE